MRSQGKLVSRGNTKYMDTNSIFRLGSYNEWQSNKYEIAIHSLTFWSRTLSEEEIEARFTKGLYE